MTTRNKRVRFGANNFLTDLDSAEVSVSSEMLNFGKANLTNEQRSKVFRTNGNFTIGSSNNKIYINDGSDKTVTLTSGNYSGGAAMASHVQTQLNASSSDWTCTYSSSTRKFTLSRSSGTDTLRFSETTDAAWDTLGWSTAVDTSAATAGTSDFGVNHTDEHITIDLGVPMSVKEFHAVGPLRQIFGISSTATIQLLGNTMDSWDSPALTVTLTRDDGGIHHYLDDQEDTSYRYWRFRWVDRLNTAGPHVKIGHLYLGDYDTVTTTDVAPGLVKRYIDSSEVAESESGVQFFRTGSLRRVFDSLTIGYIEADERRTLESLYEKVGNETPLYFCFDPLNEISANLSEVTIYGRFEQEPRFQHAIRDLFSMNFAIVEAA